ncbi:hypothetical protein DNTS_008251 [Danionella cerebrum]|uniref:Uncharacterized protein n=1 Tax=Danionella cerebrum TaxID=2873325 RepID=A0A553R6B9_9TELE|nr:hypothetical protein DNTS_008251 [Danionella translucida]
MSQDEKKPLRNTPKPAVEALREEMRMEIEELRCRKQHLIKRINEEESRCQQLQIECQQKEETMEKLISATIRLQSAMGTDVGGSDALKFYDIIKSISSMYQRCTQTLGVPQESEDSLLQLDMINNFNQIASDRKLKET